MNGQRVDLRKLVESQKQVQARLQRFKQYDELLDLQASKQMKIEQQNQDEDKTEKIKRRKTSHQATSAKGKEAKKEQQEEEQKEQKEQKEEENDEFFFDITDAAYGYGEKLMRFEPQKKIIVYEAEDEQICHELLKWYMSIKPSDKKPVSAMRWEWLYGRGVRSYNFVQKHSTRKLFPSIQHKYYLAEAAWDFIMDKLYTLKEEDVLSNNFAIEFVFEKQTLY